ncbi:uncharacterized protein LOC113328040 [Papaver somniferum]|uniref:uncharacterized protein LOC113328040 n=1 Tax=Papaver somniferum TaxID=3469 RepID=UPI000E700B21|nr:uncharacterized protein LOC113328040 [Papaver somniferum]
MHESSKAAIQRSVALILMKYNDYVGARNKLLEARTSDPGLEYIDELIKVCDMVCAVNSQGSGISWCSVLGINNTADQDDIEFGYKELMRTLEPVKNKFPEIQSALGLIGKAYSEFDSRGAASLFTVGQFLAVYDQEKMPRVYAQIIGIESCYKKETNSTDNILYVRWLRPAPTNPDERKWHEAGLPVSCGFFKIDSVGKCDIGAISHLVSSFREYHYSDKLFELYPQEGEVWALYEEWKPFDWCSDPKTGKGCKFSLVEILSDYSAAAGFKVASLGKVAGYSTIFRRSGESYHIDASKLFGFSHDIPVRSTGDMKGLFAGTVLDLDPLSVPKDVVVDTVAAEFSNGSSSIMHQNSFLVYDLGTKKVGVTRKYRMSSKYHNILSSKSLL